MSINEFRNFIVGAAVGAAAAALLTPKSGSETRKFLRSKAEEGNDYIASRASEVCDTASQAIERGKKAVQHQADTLTAAVDASKRAVKDQTDNLRAAVDAGKEVYREAVLTTPQR